MIHGKIKHYQLFSEAVEGWTAAAGGALTRTLEMLPPKVPGTNIRNYLLGLEINFQGDLVDNALAPRAFTARELHNLFGTIGYKDAWGMMLPPTTVDRLTASNFSEGIQSPDKHGTTHGIASAGLGAAYHIDHNVILAYSPKAFADKQHRAVKWNGCFPCCLLGQDAELGVVFCGQQYDADAQFTAAPVVTVTAVVWQSRELIVPAPTQILETLLESAQQDPYIEEGEARKIEDMFILYHQVGPAHVPIGFWTSAALIGLDFDGNEVFYGPCWQLMDSIALQRNHDHGFRGTNEPGNAAAVAGIVWNNDFYQGHAATLIDADGFEQATQGRSVRRLELRNHRGVEQRSTLHLIQRRRFECSQHLFEKWCEREGIGVGERSDIRIAGATAKNSGLSRGEAIGVQATIGSRKERR